MKCIQENSREYMKRQKKDLNNKTKLNQKKNEKRNGIKVQSTYKTAIKMVSLCDKQ